MITLLPSDVQGVDAPPRWCTSHCKVLCWTGTDTWFVMNCSSRRQRARCEVRPWLCKVSQLRIVVQARFLGFVIGYFVLRGHYLTIDNLGH